MKITRKRVRPVLGAVAVAAAAGMVLAGCTTSTPSSEASSSGKTITMAQVNEVTSFNYNTPQGNLDINGMINYMTQPQFFTLNQKYDIERNTDLGTYKKLSNDPLKVEYTLNKGDKWSDGTAMTADDLLLGWAIGSCYYDSSKTNDNGDVVSGTQYFSTAGGCVYQTDLPKVSNDNRTITFTYKQPYVDWELVNPIQLPAHVVASEIGVSTKDLTKAFMNTPAGDADNPAPANKTLEKAAKFVNTGYDTTSLPKDKKLLVSGGPLVVSAWTPKQSMTLVPNKYYTGKHKVNFGKLVIRFIADANAQVTALQNGEVDAIQPQASADTLKALKAASGVKIQTGDQVAYDHLDLNFKSSVFSDATERQAFLLTIPRDEILKSIVTPINPKAKVLDSQIFLPGQEGYDQSVKQNGSSEFDKVDIAKAKSLLAGKTPTVKILYNSQNPNRVDAFQAIQASAAKAGFKVVDGGSPQWASLLAGGDYDASIFGWVSPGAGNAMLPQLFQIGNGSNYNNFNVKEASDLAVKSQTTLDASKLLDIKMQIDKLAFTNFYGLPLFQSPGLFATNSKLKGVEYFGGQTGLVWNVWDWSK
ncbi:ABC transporter family substrate-binding protein [Humibacter albus]|uniref:ABC transporter family substrate-binding protein n=1 Tax=Humibacter albus TaxID=427754 RepID=UPI0003B56719|nr:ABC transporter family substrate-binding protein [Humibacter albus]